MVAWVVLALLAWQEPDYVEQGRKALDLQHNEEAAALFRKAVAADGKNFAAHFHLALADSLLKNDSEAITEYQRTLELKPDLFQANLNLGMLLVRNGRASEAVTPLEKAVAEKPQDFRPSLYLGEALRQGERFGEAQPMYESALKANSKSAAAEIGLARTLLALHQLDSAELHFRAAGELDPALRDAILELASAQEKAGHAEQAIKIYQQLPGNAIAEARLGELLVASQQFGDAIPRLEKAVRESPTVTNRLNLADAYRMQKQFAKQNEQLNQVVAAEPKSFEYRMIYGRALRDQRQFVPAANQFYAAAQINPQSVEAWNELASSLLIHGDNVQGLAALDKVRALGKESPGDFYLRAITEDKLHMKREAVDSYKHFLSVSEGKLPDQEFAARQRIRIIESELHKR